MALTNSRVDDFAGSFGIDPFDPDGFQFQVHALNPAYGANEAAAAEHENAEAKAPVYDADGAQKSQRTNLSEYPERLNRLVSLSTSVINQDHLYTWESAGLIVGAPKHTVFKTTGGDGFVGNSDPTSWSRQGPAHASGDELIAHSAAVSYNEAAVETGELQLLGFFSLVDEQGHPHNEEIARCVKEHAERLGLPLIEIDTTRPFRTDRLVAHDPRQYAYFENQKYLLKGYDPKEQLRRHGASRDPIPQFPSPQEWDRLLGFLETQGMNNAELTRLKMEHKQRDHDRQQPEISFRENGSVGQIAFLSGYGEEEIRTTVSAGGLISQPRRSKTTIPAEPIDGDTVLARVKNSFATLTPQQRERAEQWFDSCQFRVSQITPPPTAAPLSLADTTPTPAPAPKQRLRSWARRLITGR